MEKFYLVFPDESYREEWAEIVGEMEKETLDLTPYALRHQARNYDEYLSAVRLFSKGLNLPTGKVRSDVFFLVRLGEKRILGAIDIRYELNEYLFSYGGNIGYGVRPSERRKGYATKMLALALEICQQSGIKKVLVTCDETNPGSRRTIEKNGGVLENVVSYEGENVMRFWIDLSRTKPSLKD
jgi:predicted acetyltransferase